MDLDPEVRAYYDKGSEAARLFGGFPSGPLGFARTKEIIERHLPSSGDVACRRDDGGIHRDAPCAQAARPPAFTGTGAVCGRRGSLLDGIHMSAAHLGVKR